MILKVRVVSNARKNSFDGKKVYVTAPAVAGKANEAVIRVIAEHYGIKKSAVRILRGEKSHDKVLELTDVWPEVKQ